MPSSAGAYSLRPLRPGGVGNFASIDAMAFAADGTIFFIGTEVSTGLLKQYIYRLASYDSSVPQPQAILVSTLNDLINEQDRGWKVSSTAQ